MMNILKRTPDGVLWLYKSPQIAIGRLQAAAASHGVDPKRIIFGPPMSPKVDHLQRLKQADLGLDT